ncbi:hypothetical protein, partial [Mucilaginibacter sp.]|uniref:hypothetical protein n=1 Tax=Mucilaginibacter sp. TaxID=1882438 RepID=UPI00263779EB
YLMKKRFLLWLRFWFWIDFLGVFLSLTLTITYLVWGNYASEHLQNLWSNLAVEIAGVWISVRIIDFLLQRSKSFRKSRFQTLDNLNFFYRKVQDIIIFSTLHEADVQVLGKEVVYFDKRWGNRKKQFYKDEKEQIDLLMIEMNNIYQFIKSQQDKTDPDVDFKNRLKEKAYSFSEKLEVLRLNIWEETNPDN